MLKRTFLLCILLLLVTAFSSIAFAAAPYASILAYNQGTNRSHLLGENNGPNFSTLGVMDVVNMTPWNISMGNAPLATPMFTGMTEANWNSFWLAGFNKPSSNNTNFGGSYAYHSYQVALKNLNNAWVLANTIPGKANTGAQKNWSYAYVQPCYWETVPIVFNSTSFTQGGNTVALDFSVTSSVGFDGQYISNKAQDIFFPATALSFGDGTNNYGWESGETMVQSGIGLSMQNTTHFLTIQGLGSTANNWKPITKNLGGVTAKAGTDGAAPSTPVQMPNLLNVAGMVYPNFSAVAGDSQNFDLVVILQAGGFGDMQVLFLAVPHNNNNFL